jgi:phage terminase large subunit GpA-like protein
MMDACSDPSIQEVVVMAGAQLGKTEAILNIIGYHIDNDPSPILVMQPTVKMAEAFSKDRVASGLLASSPCLQSKVKDPRSRDSGNTTLHKVFPGGALTMVGANSAADLASRPIRVVLCDEVDRYPVSAGTEGDPISLAVKRTITFWNRKIIMVSTPTNKGASRIEDAYQQSDQRKYYVPCRHCTEGQVLKWSNVQWDKDNPESARYLCDNCDTEWSESDRIWSIRNGIWVATKPFNGVAGFAINGMYSPWTPLSAGVKDFLAVKKNPEQLKVWTNTYLGETWEDSGERLDYHALSDRREEMPYLPDDVYVITAGADVQDNRLEIEIVGWGKDDESYVLDFDVLYGDPSSPQLWGDLDTILWKQYKTAGGRELGIRATAVDSGGHYTNSVYKYCKKNAGRRIFAIKGIGGEGKPVASKPSRNNVGKCPLFMIGVNTVKDIVFARLKLQEEGPSYVHFSDRLEDDFFKQLTAEKKVTRYHKGFPRSEYQKASHARNEALDCLVYAIAAYVILNVNINALAAKVEKEANKKPIEVDRSVKKHPALARQTVRQGGFVNSWR